MQLVIITPEKNVADEQKIINALLKTGADRLHVRKPGYDTAAYDAYIRAIPEEYRSRIVIHGAYELYAETGIGGIHLRSAIRNDRNITDRLSHIPQEAMSTSFHSWQEITSNKTPYGHVFISPLYNSISKPGYEAAVPADGIMQARGILAAKGIKSPLITGLGGICKDNIAALKRYGYDGAALLGAIWHTNDPVAAFTAIRQVIEMA